jgi:hypothetical protein
MALRFKENAPHPLAATLSGQDGAFDSQFETDGRVYVNLLFPEHGTASNIPAEQLYDTEEEGADTVYQQEDTPGFWARIFGRA